MGPDDDRLSGMYNFCQNHRVRHFVVVVVALLISNIAMLSCAMAYAMCAECPEHAPALCTDSCATADTSINDTSIDKKTDTYRPFSDPYTLLTVDLAFMREHLPPGDQPGICNYSSPPLHLQFCVFLK